MAQTVVKVNSSVELEEPKKLPIVFTHCLMDLGVVNCRNIAPGQYEYIELLVKGYQYNSANGPAIGKHDLMLAYHKNRSDGALYIGQFNDGIVKEETK